MPSAPPTKISSRFGCRAMAAMPPFRAPGVIEVMLSTNRWVPTSVSLAAMSLPAEIRWEPSAENVVSSTQSLCEPMYRTCSPVLASMALTPLSAQPRAIFEPSGDQLAP